MYAMVNVSQYQIVATGTSVMDCETNYRAMLARSGLIGETQAELTPAEELHTRTGVIEEYREIDRERRFARQGHGYDKSDGSNDQRRYISVAAAGIVFFIKRHKKTERRVQKSNERPDDGKFSVIFQYASAYAFEIVDRRNVKQ